MRHISIPLETPIEFIDMSPLEFSPLISKCKIKVCYVGDEPNRNGSIITKEVAMNMAPSLRGAMIVGHYNNDKKDFEEHNEIIKIKNGEYNIVADTYPYGFVDIGAKAWFQKYLDDDEIEREYLVTEGFLWTKQLPECKRVLSTGNGQSMELDRDLTKGSWTQTSIDDLSFFIINESVISKLCILGEDVEPCFEGANITNTQFSLKNNIEFKNSLFSLMAEMKEILSKGGVNQMQNENEMIQEETQNIEGEIEQTNFNNNEEVVEENVEEVITTEVEVIEEVVTETVESSYDLDKIPEYLEAQETIRKLQEQLTEITNSFNSLNDNYTTLLNEIEGLRSFKLEAEKKEKQELIDSFYMLSDEDKKEFVENIDKYSTKDIKAELSILCVDKKVNFAKGDEPNNTPITYSVEDNYDSTPSWIKAVLDTAKEMQ